MAAPKANNRTLAQLAIQAQQQCFAADAELDPAELEVELNRRLRQLQVRADGLARTMVASGSPPALVALALANTAATLARK